MSKIDLHTHSTASDGTFSPRELVLHAKNNNVGILALTDHDTVDGIAEAMEAAKKENITLIPGIEIGARYKNKELHILGLFIDPTSKQLQEKLYGLKEIRNKRNEEMIEKFKEIGIPISLEELNVIAKGKVISRAHVAKLLLEKGYISSIQEAFDKYITPGKPAYVEKQDFSPKEVIEMIQDAGGIAILAHPKLLFFEEKELKELFSELKSLGLVGIEAIYPLYSKEEEVYYRNLAKEFDFLITGGSDFHGNNKPDIKIGTGKGNVFVPEEVFTTLKNSLK